MRIAFLNSWPESRDQGSGTAVSIANLARGLTERGHEVVVISPDRIRSADRPLPLLLQRISFNRTVERRLRKAGPLDLVVGFDLDGFLWSTRRNGTNGTSGPPFALWLKGVAADEARFSRGVETLFLSLVARIEARNARAADRVLVPSRYSAGVAASTYGLPGSVLGVVPEAIDLDEWLDPEHVRSRRAVRPSEDRPLRILSVARQYPRKDTATLLRAVPRVVSAGVPVHLRVIGGGPELPALRRLVRTLAIEHQVELSGSVDSSDEVREAYRSADLFGLPSLQEGFGLVFLEAMASGLPIVAARAGATPEVIGDGAAGRLVPPGDPEELARALVELARDPALRDRMSAAGYRRVQEYSLGNLADRFLAASRPVPT